MLHLLRLLRVQTKNTFATPATQPKNAKDTIAESAAHSGELASDAQIRGV
jgi:hypothetical protein